MNTFFIFTIRKMSNGKTVKKYVGRVTQHSATTAKYSYVANTGYRGTLMARKVKETTTGSAVRAALSQIKSESLKIEQRAKAQQVALESAYQELVGLVKVLRRGDMGDISPIMDEIFDSEHAIEEVQKTTLPVA